MSIHDALNEIPENFWAALFGVLAALSGAIVEALLSQRRERKREADEVKRLIAALRLEFQAILPQLEDDQTIGHPIVISVFQVIQSRGYTSFVDPDVAIGLGATNAALQLLNQKVGEQKMFAAAMFIANGHPSSLRDTAVEIFGLRKNLKIRILELLPRLEASR